MNRNGAKDAKALKIFVFFAPLRLIN